MAAPMILNLPLVQELAYNGVTWNASTLVEQFSMRPQRSACGRTFTHVDFSLTASMWLDASGDAGRSVSAIISALVEPAAGLRFNGRGFGNLEVNLGKVKDVKWGPFPTACRIVSRGPDQKVKIAWSVEWSTPTCGDAVFEGAQPYEFAWKLSFGIDKSGFTTRVYSGFIRVPATRLNAGDHRLPLTVDVMRERINPPLLTGYRRTPGTFEIDYSKTRCDFSITDTQFRGNVPPPGVIDGSVRHTLSSTPGNPYLWNGSLSASYELAAGQPASAAWVPFFQLLGDRWASVRLVGKLLPWQFTMSEPNGYDTRVVELGVNYRVTGATLRQMLAYGGLWRPIPGSDWRKWAASLPSHLSARGVSGLVLRTDDDEITDLCKPVAVSVDLRGNRPAPGVGPVVPGAGGDRAGAATLTAAAAWRNLFPPPTPAGSYLEYTCGYKIVTDDGVVVSSTLPSSPLGERPATTGVLNALNPSLVALRERSFYPPSTDVVPSGGGRLETDSAAGRTIAHRRTSPNIFVHIAGHAKRVGYPVPVPELVEVGAKTVTPANRAGMGEGFQQAIIGGDAAGNPLYAAKWNLRYVVVETPTGPMPVPPNPTIGPAI